MKWHTTIFLGLLGTWSANIALSAQESPLTSEKTRVSGNPVTNESVEAGLRAMRDTLRASPAFRKNDGPTHRRLGKVLSQQGDPNGAIEEYQAAIQLNPSLAETYRELGAVYLDTHEWPKAEQALKQAVKRNPQDHQAFYWLGRSLMAQQHFSQARGAFEMALQLNSHDAEFYSDLGLVLMALGHLKETENVLRQAIDLQPDYAEAHHRLERARAAQDDPQELIRSAQQILRTLFRRE